MGDDTNGDVWSGSLKNVIGCETQASRYGSEMVTEIV